MASTKEYLEYVMEQLNGAGFSDVRCRPMMGGVFIVCGWSAGRGDS